MGTRLRLTRSGGLAGLDMVASVDVDELPASTASQVHQALARLDTDARAVPAPGPPQGADRYQYDVEVMNEHGRHSFVAHEPHVPPSLRALVDLLLPLARPQ